MKSSKRQQSVMIVYAIAAVVFVVLTLAIPFPKPAASWMMFAFTLVSFAGGCGITLFAFSKSDELKSKFYGYPVFRIGFLYTIIQLAFTLLVYIIGGFVDVPYWVGLALSVLLMGLAAIGVITTDTARDFVEETEAKTVVATRTIRRFQVDIADVLDMCKDQAVYPSLKKLVEKFKYSDIVSSDETAPVEEQIKVEINELRGMIATESTEVLLTKVEKISNLLSSRNRQCENAKRN